MSKAQPHHTMINSPTLFTAFLMLVAAGPMLFGTGSAAETTSQAKTKPAALPHRFGREAALQDVRQMTVASGLQVSLFACEPDLVNPCDMDVDERGRVWITEGANYRSSFQKWGILRPEGDRIVVLEDTNGDGAADKTRIFYQDPSINSALGICVLGNKAIVSSSPNIFI